MADTTTIAVGAFAFLLALFVILLIFWVWMFIDMLNSRRLTKQSKLILGILFFVASLVTAIVWFFARRRV